MLLSVKCSFEDHQGRQRLDGGGHVTSRKSEVKTTLRKSRTREGKGRPGGGACLVTLLQRQSPSVTLLTFFFFFNPRIAEFRLHF